MSNIRITTLPFCCAVELAWYAHPNNSLQGRLRRCLCCLATKKCAMKTRVSNRLLLLAGAFILSVGAAVIAPPTMAATYDIDIQDYCSTNYGAGRPSAVLVSNDAYGWRCRVGWHIFYNDLDVDMRNACMQQHGVHSRPYLVNNDPSNPYGWRCR